MFFLILFKNFRFTWNFNKFNKSTTSNYHWTFYNIFIIFNKIWKYIKYWNYYKNYSFLNTFGILNIHKFFFFYNNKLNYFLPSFYSNWNIYNLLNIIHNYNNFFLFLLNKFNILLNILFFNIKWIGLASIISLLYLITSLFYISIDFTQQIIIWFTLIITYYLLISTFNNFLVKYKYGKFTSAIQRFWKRTGIIFWLLEGFLFLLFFYYFLNSSQEPLYMYDYANLNQELLISLKTSYWTLLLLSFAIYLSFILILNNNFLNYTQNIILLGIISLIIFYMLFIESYQFVYIIMIFNETEWIFDEQTRTWELEIETNLLRVKQQYFILCLIAKYWHFIFIFISWFFFLIKCIEINKINYNLMGYNVQNLIILYILNLMCLIQWLKWVVKKFLEITYYWFHIQYDEKFLFSFFNEIFNIMYSIFYINIKPSLFLHIKIISNIFYCSNELNLWKYI